ncbi:YaiI/YqxD family protein [Clostridioides mangenotii]|uniref:YaiI/YqxD family protein n=1 Tax=Metaclostridioides mangenotii TaxID=1540 RepID=UPI001C12836A|nr:YaiI/YqxD family protein [Clostridioides mangenotii]MBU5308277.1 YaiI/YqxD family protein [Clostridioides mangenotii]MCR1955132.1 YaiI/YqxD family protein [Clostridioides mangenotii]
MVIFVDADACPVKKEIVKVAKDYGLKVKMFTDTTHDINDGYSNVIVVEKGSDSVDFAIINKIKEKDILVTQDYGLASMALGKKAFVIHQNGFLYTLDNIDQMLFERHLNSTARRGGFKTSNPKKRKEVDNAKFEACLIKLVNKLLHG